MAFRDLETFNAEMFVPDYSARLVARSIALVPVIRANARKFAEAISEVQGSRREGDQLGALLAGAHSLHSVREISQEAAREYIKRLDWSESPAGQQDPDETRLLRHILEHRVRIAGAEVPVWRLLETALNADGMEAEDARRNALAVGIKPDCREGDRGIYISATHSAIAAMLEDTPWAAGAWSRSLARLPGAVAGRSLAVQRFGFGPPHRAVWIPESTIFGD